MEEGKKRKNRKDIDERRRELENKVRTTGRELLDCPACGKRHEVLIQEVTAVAGDRKNNIRYPEQFFYCPETDKAFEKGYLVNENRAAAFEAMLKQLGK